MRAQIAVANADFSATNSNFGHTTRPAWDAVKGNPMLEFCLAQTDPTGNATTGIVRHAIQVTGSSTSSSNIADIKDDIFWDTDKYMNIYVLSIPGTDAFGGVVGYAYLPFSGTIGTGTDGIVVDYNWFGGNGLGESGDKTLTHEIGHYLGLYHTFNGSSCNADDGLSDTPNMDGPTSNYDFNLSCGNAMYPVGPNSCDDEHMYINYMDYMNDDNCSTSFTSDQVAVMRGVLTGVASNFGDRTDLVSHSSVACTPSICNLSLNATSVNPSCNGSSDGASTISVTGGNAPYTFTWSTTPTQTSATATNLAGGTYTVTVSDNRNCTTVTTVSIIEPDDLQINATVNDESVINENDGNISVTALGGISPYSYQWNTGQGSQSISNLSPGIYRITVTDGNDCTATRSFSINEGQCYELDITANTIDLFCNGDNSGQAAIVMENGIAPYSYIWNGNSGPQQRSNLGAGNYSISVTDNLGCSGTTNFSISQPNRLFLNISSSPVSGLNLNDGAARVVASGGTSPYSYSWNSGLGNSSIITNLPPDNYSVTVTDSNGCSESGVVTVEDFECSPLTATVSSQNIDCFGENSGSIQVNNISGRSPYSFSWNTGSTAAFLNNVPAGAYRVTIIDANECQLIESITLTEPLSELGVLSTSASESGTNLNDGEIELFVSGGTPNYSYNWSNGATTNVINDLVPGIYSCTISDANGCEILISAEVGSFVCSDLNVELNKVDLSCFQSQDGQISATDVNGKAPFNYVWSNGSEMSDLHNLSNGAYSVIVSDANGCSGSASVVVLQPEDIQFDLQVVDESFEDTNDGQIAITASGGTGTLSYLWSDGNIEPNRNNLAPGLYELTITDENECQKEVSAGVAEFMCDEIIYDPIVTNINCHGDSSGIIDLNIEQALAPFTIEWSSTVETTEVISDLGSGSYSYTITDAMGCFVVNTLNITEPEVLQLNLEVQHESIFEGEDGQIQAQVTGGTAPYQYNWSNELASSEILDLATGAYQISITDSLGCMISDSVNIEAYVCPSIDIQLSVVDIECNGNANGSIASLISGGAAPYNYSWSNDESISNLEGFGPGSYTLSVTDTKNCQVSKTATIKEPPPILISLEVIHESFEDLNDGQIATTATGGFGTLSYLWNDSNSEQNRTDLPPGQYSLTITDANGCQQGAIANIEEFTCHPILDDPIVININCNGDSTGIIDLNIQQALTPYTVEWSSTEETTDVISDLGSGSYSYTITDAMGCFVVNTINITEPEVLQLNLEVQHESIFEGEDGQLQAEVTGGTAPYQYNWSNGLASSEIFDLVPGAYQITITDSLGCMLSESVDIDTYVCPVLEVELLTEDIDCNGNANGSIASLISGGAAPYAYIWSNDESISNLEGFGPGSYTLSVTDTKNCQISKSATINEPPLLVISLDVIHESFEDFNDGQIATTTLGGFGALSYLWNDGNTQKQRTDLPPGTYSLTITDANGCRAEASTLVEEFICNPIIFDPVVTHINCYGENSGAIDLNIQQALVPFTIEWSSTEETTDIISDLSSGVYTYTITDARDCVVTNSIEVTEPDPLEIFLQVQHESSFEGKNGSINAEVIGGTGSYQYTWNNGFSSNSIFDLSPGTYQVSVTDSLGCMMTGETQINEYICSEINIEFLVEDVDCNGNKTGNLQSLIEGGEAPYSYNWSNGATTQDLFNQAAGSYALSLVDTKNCQVIQNVTITEPDDLLLSLEVQHESAVNNNDGKMQLIVIGGTLPYEFEWSDASKTRLVDNLSPGQYSATVTDANGCTATIAETIIPYQCPELNLDFNIQEITCYDAGNGEIEAIAGLGTAPYTFDWGDGPTSNKIHELTPGTYAVTVTDNKGCTIDSEIKMENPEPIILLVDKTDEQKNDANNGSADIEISGGLAPYDILWSDNATGANRSDLMPGIYGISISDANGCVIITQLEIFEFICPDLGLTVTTVDNVCFDGDMGSLDFTSPNGVGPYALYLNNQMQTSEISGLKAGSYDLRIVDQQNCSAETSFEIETPLAMHILDKGITHQDGILPGSANINLLGGTPPYNINWPDGYEGSKHQNLYAGNHQIIISDAEGCLLADTITVFQLDELNAIPQLELFVAHPNPTDDKFRLQLEFQRKKQIRIVISSNVGRVFFDSEIEVEQYDVELDVSKLPQGYYNISVYSDDKVMTKALLIF
ncbi:MAG: hypothetical protein KJP00_04115 [Bacteroidia bacterium]|nr:hypothetical protein [Bacteroidia bacterium]